MNFFKSRLRRLEESIRGGSKCPECGLSAGDPEARRLVWTWPGDDRSALLEEARAECCQECGRPEIFHLRMVYDR